MSIIQTSNSLQEMPDIEKAKHKMEANLIKDPKGEKYPIISTPISVLGICGPGVELYFRFLKQMILLFGILTVFAIPLLAINISGKYLAEEATEPTLVRVTLGNQDGVPYDCGSIEEGNDKLDEIRPYKYTTIYLDLIYSIFMFVFLLVMERRINKQLVKSLQDNITPSDYSVDVKNIPHFVKEQELKDFFGKYGTISDIAIAKDYKGLYGIFGSKLNIEKQILREEKRLLINPQTSSKSLQSLQEKDKAIENKIRKKLLQIHSYDDFPNCRAYVTFNEVSGKLACMNHYSKLNTCQLFKKIPESEKFQNCSIKVNHAPEPTDIQFENLELANNKKIFRGLVGFFVSIALLCVSFSLLILLEYYKEQLPNYRDCVEYVTEVEYDDIYESEVEIQVSCYCSTLSSYDVVFNSKYRDVCEDYRNKLLTAEILGIVLCLSVSILNVVIKLFLKYAARFQKISTKTKEYSSLVVKVFVVVFCNMVVVLILVHGNGEESGISTGIIFSGSYYEFLRIWYSEVGVTAMTIIMINLFNPHIMEIVFFVPFSKIKQRIFRKKKVLQSDLDELYEPREFHLEEKYPIMMANVFAMLIYSSGLPLMLFFGLLYFIILYIVEKIMIFRFYKKPAQYGPEMHKSVMAILPFACILHCFMAIFMYGTSDIYPTSVIDFTDLIDGELKPICLAEYIPPEDMVVFLFLAEVGLLIIWKLVDEIRKYYRTKSAKVASEAVTEDQGTFEENKEMMKKINIVSYHIEDHPQYASTVEIMKKILSQSAILSKKITLSDIKVKQKYEEECKPDSSRILNPK